MGQEGLYLRAAGPADMDILFQWANDGTTRKNAFHTGQIPYEEHKKWFEALLRDDGQLQYILMLRDDAVGQARLSINGNCAEVNYSIAPEKRGRGFGRELIRLVRLKVLSEYPCIRKLVARVKPENTASVRCFQGNGFSEVFIQYESGMGSAETGLPVTVREGGIAL